jgi:hypothetical protein
MENGAGDYRRQEDGGKRGNMCLLRTSEINSGTVVCVCDGEVMGWVTTGRLG